MLNNINNKKRSKERMDEWNTGKKVQSNRQRMIKKDKRTNRRTNKINHKWTKNNNEWINEKKDVKKKKKKNGKSMYNGGKKNMIYTDSVYSSINPCGQTTDLRTDYMRR